MKSFRIAVLAAALLTAPTAASAQDGEGELFDHNGSTIVAQYRYGNLRYLTVKPSLRGLVDQGMAVFSGQIERRGKVDGTAYVFKRGCDFVPYDVKGHYDESIPGYVMTGAYPVREKKGCKVVGYSDKGANARLVFVDLAEKERREADEYMRQVYETESDPNWMDGFITAEELEERNRMRGEGKR